MPNKSSLNIPGLILGLLLSGTALVALSDEFDQKDITYPEGQTADDISSPTVEELVEEPPSAGHDKIEKIIIKVPVSEQGSRNKLELPVAGMNQEDVKNKWGQPNSVRNAVGNPPISSWKYDDFSVYFEHGHVIRSVIKPSKTN